MGMFAVMAVAVSRSHWQRWKYDGITTGPKPWLCLSVIFFTASQLLRWASF